MKNQELRTSLIKSGIILILCIFFIYSFASGESGGITGTLGSLVSALVFIVGLSVALLVSVVVLFGIYFLILYLYKPDSCGTTFDEMKVKFSEVSKSMGCGCCSHTTKSVTCGTTTADDETTAEADDKDTVIAAQFTELQRELASIQGTLDTVKTDLSATSSVLSTMDARFLAIEEDLAKRPTQDNVTESTQQIAADIGKLQGSLSPIQGNISELEATVKDLSNKSEDDGDPPQEQIESAVLPLKEELASIQQTLATLAEQAATAVIPEDKGEEHRILSYFGNKGDAKAFTTNVVAAVNKGMTYAEIGEFLDDNLSAEASEVIADHPSLTKDYIRTCRQSN